MTLSRVQHHNWQRWYVSLGILLMALLYASLCLLLPLPKLSSRISSSYLRIKTAAAHLPWPDYGEAAVGMLGLGVTQTNGAQTPLPTASVAKLITALAVLQKDPLSIGQQGPLITLDTTDYGFYTTYLSEQGSVVPIYSGEQLSEYQMLEAMLVPSGNNIADSLARWAFGSVASYDSYANTLVKKLGMSNTHVAGDASGFLPATTSTASDLIILGTKVMANPLLQQIVGSKSVTVPNVGVLNNYDNILGVDGIVGIKTGNSNQAGGVFLSASNANIDGTKVILLTAVMGAFNLTQALNDSVPLVISLHSNFTKTTLVNKGTVLGEIKQPWGGTIQLAAKDSLSLLALRGQDANVYLKLQRLSVPSPAGTELGSVSTLANQLNPPLSVAVTSLQTTTKPSALWRLLHPQEII